MAKYPLRPDTIVATARLIAIEEFIKLSEW